MVKDNRCKPKIYKSVLDCDLPRIPEKRYLSISEVSELCSLEPYILRYWEQEFSQLAPVKRKGNRRFYQKQDVELIRKIRKLLYEDGFTLEGARAQLKFTKQSLSQQNNLHQTLNKLIADFEAVLQNLRSNTDVDFIHQ